MKGTRSLFSILLLLLIPSFCHASGFDIRIKVNHLKDTTLILGHYLNKSMYPDDTIRLSDKGTGVFTGKQPLSEGMYVIFMPSHKYFDLIMGKDQEFSIETDTADFMKTLSFKGSEENEIFMNFQQYMLSLRNTADSLNTRMRQEKDPKIKMSLGALLKKLNNERNARIDAIYRDHPDLFVSVFLRATQDVAVPDAPRDKKGDIRDSTWQYYYYRDHYFDNFNLSDPRLLRTPLYEDKVMNYITRIVPQIPDSLYGPIDYLIGKSRNDSTLFRFMLITLFNYYGKSNIMGMDAVQVYIADKYYLHDSWWSDTKFLAELKDRVEKTRPLLIGKVAPNVELMLVPAEHFIQAAQDTALKKYPHVGTKITLDQVQAPYLVLIFWDADCGHCKVAVPELYNEYEKNLKKMGVKILAVSTLFGEDGKVKWVDFVNAHGLYDWMNAWNPYSYDFKLKYDITSTPQIYILDENKKILAKRISPEQVQEILTSLIKMQKTNPNK